MTVLEVQGCKVPEHLFPRICKTVPNLQGLNIIDQYLPDAALKSLSLLASLVRLEMKNNPQVTSETIQLVLGSCPNLEILNLAFCRELDSSAFELPEGSKTGGLRVLNVSACHNITDAILTHLNPRKLEVLNLTSTQVGDALLEFLPKVETTLCYLNVESTWISLKVANFVFEKLPRLSKFCFNSAVLDEVDVALLRKQISETECQVKHPTFPQKKKDTEKKPETEQTATG